MANLAGSINPIEVVGYFYYRRHGMWDEAGRFFSSNILGTIYAEHIKT